MASRPLVVAISAGVALVALLAVDLALDRTVALDVRDGDEWRTLSTTSATRARYPEAMGSTVRAPENGSVEFRLRIDNGYPTAADGDYTVMTFGRIVAEGRVQAAARSEGEVTFRVATNDLLGGQPRPVKTTEGAVPELVYTSLEVQTLGRHLVASFQVEVTGS